MYHDHERWIQIQRVMTIVCFEDVDFIFFVSLDVFAAIDSNHPNRFVAFD